MLWIFQFSTPVDPNTQHAGLVTGLCMLCSKCSSWALCAQLSITDSLRVYHKRKTFPSKDIVKPLKKDCTNFVKPP